MRVTLIRHAEAGDDAPRDESRSLTTRGREDARRLGAALARRGVEFSLVISSPLVRAVQTAEIVAAEIAYRERIAISDALCPDGTASQVIALVESVIRKAESARKAESSPSIALVAHEPILSTLAAALIGKARYPPLHKTEALRIRISSGASNGRLAGEGILRWRVDARGHREQL
jgi:phosphohistidine phosphatase